MAEPAQWAPAEIEFSVLVRQCLGRRLPDAEALCREVWAWEGARNAAGSRIDWRFTTADARIKLKHLYPVPLPDQCGTPSVSED